MVAPSTLILEERIRMADAATLRATLLKLLDTGGPVHIDGSRVREIDSASLQLLASLWRSAAALQFECSWSATSEPLRRAARLTGMVEILAMPSKVL